MVCCLPGLPDIDRRHDQRHFTEGRCLPETAPHLALRAALQHGPVHIRGPARHRGSGVDVLLHGVLGEVFRRDDRDLPRVDVGLRRHAEHTTEMVHMAVGVDDCDNRAVAAVRSIKRERGGRGLGADQRVDDDDPGVTFDEADVGQVESTDLIDPLDNFVEALLGAQLALPPQAGVYCVRRIAVQERVNIVVPHHSSVGRLDDAGFQRPDEAPIGVVEVRGVGEGQIVHVRAVG